MIERLDVIRKVLPAGDSLTKASAQRYGIKMLNERPVESESAISIRDWNASGSFVLYIPKITVNSTHIVVSFLVRPEPHSLPELRQKDGPYVKMRLAPGARDGSLHPSHPGPSSC